MKYEFKTLKWIPSFFFDFLLLEMTGKICISTSYIQSLITFCNLFRFSYWLHTWRMIVDCYTIEFPTTFRFLRALSPPLVPVKRICGTPQHSVTTRSCNSSHWQPLINFRGAERYRELHLRCFRKFSREFFFNWMLFRNALVTKRTRKTYFSILFPLSCFVSCHYLRVIGDACPQFMRINKDLLEERQKK